MCYLKEIKKSKRTFGIQLFYNKDNIIQKNSFLNYKMIYLKYLRLIFYRITCFLIYHNKEI